MIGKAWLLQFCIFIEVTNLLCMLHVLMQEYTLILLNNFASCKKKSGSLGASEREAFVTGLSEPSSIRWERTAPTP